MVDEEEGWRERNWVGRHCLLDAIMKARTWPAVCTREMVEGRGRCTDDEAVRCPDVVLYSGIRVVKDV